MCFDSTGVLPTGLGLSAKTVTVAVRVATRNAAVTGSILAVLSDRTFRRFAYLPASIAVREHRTFPGERNDDNEDACQVSS